MHSYEPRLWGLAIATFFVGDWVLTSIGLELLGTYETAWPAYVFYDQWGATGLFVQKLLLATGLAAILLPWDRLDRMLTAGDQAYRLVIPAVVTIRGTWICAWNLVLMLQVAGIPVPSVVPHPDIILNITEIP